jgi:hypothetical protein
MKRHRIANRNAHVLVRRAGALKTLSALRRNSTGGPFHAAFLKAANSVLVAAMRWAFKSK